MMVAAEKMSEKADGVSEEKNGDNQEDLDRYRHQARVWTHYDRCGEMYP